MAKNEKPEHYISEEQRNALADSGGKLGSEFWLMPEDRAMERYLYNMTRQFRESEGQKQSASGALDDSNIHNDDTWDTSPSDRHKLQNVCRNLYLKDPIARNIINNHVLFVLGDGPSIHFGAREPENPDSPIERAYQRYEAFRRVNDFDRQLKTAFTLALTMGEYFFIEPQLPEDDEAQEFVKNHGILGVRGMEATRVQEIHFDPYDLMTPTQYILTYASSQIEVPESANRELGAERVMHWKINALGPHGRPILEPVVHYLLRANDMLEDRVAVSNTRARLPIIREIKRNVGAPARELPERSTVLTVPMDKERWNFPSLSLGSSEMDAELLAIYRAIAQGIGLPEVFVTMDLSRAGAFGQLAPIQVQLIRLFESYQAQLRPALEDLAHRICPWIDPDEIRIDFHKPDFLTDQIKIDLADRKLRAGLISKRMAIEAIGEDPDRVLEELAHESQATPTAPGVPGNAGGGLGGPTGSTSGLDLGLSGGLGGSEFTLPSFPDLSSQSGSASSGESTRPSTTAAPEAPVSDQAPAQAASPTRGGGALNFGNQPGAVRITSSLREEAPFNRIYAGMDFGWDMPGAVVILAERPDGNMLVLEEFVQSELQMMHTKDEPGSNPRECCWVCTLKDFDEKYGLDGIFTDPKDPEAVSVIQDHFEIPVQPVSIPVDDGVNNMRNLARDGKLLVEKNCSHLLHDTEQCEGHALDALRYSTTAMLEGF